MGKINVLDKNISELIAAGEVIERPASIVKELLENSIDAGATAITVEIRRGGISYIRITDNGCGMSKEDIPVAFLRHATSKIKASDDLENIATLGFRGEALASITAVSKVELTSKTSDMQYGTKITVVGGEQLDIDEVGSANGTTIIIRDLFYNVPARLKFLKKDTSEANSISGVIDKIALSHPEISFKFINENKIKIHTPGNNNLLEAIYAVFGKEFSSSLIPVSYELNGVSVNGYISDTNFSRTNRTMQHFFVNDRYVKSKTCVAALEEGYKNSIMVGKYPSCVLNVGVPFNTVDVNVHPAKIEIRFINERAIFDTVYFAVKSALSSGDILKKVSETKASSQTCNILSTFKSEELQQVSIAQESKPVTSANQNSVGDIKDRIMREKPSVNKLNSHTVTYNATENSEHEFSYIKPESLVKTQDNLLVNMKTGEIVLEEPKTKTAKTQVEAIKEKTEKKSDVYIKVVGEIFKTYVVFEVEDYFLLLDKHAAHERILFEKLKTSVSTLDRQILLKPIVVSVSNEEHQALTDNIQAVTDLGFSFDDFGNNSVIIREVPSLLSEYDSSDIFFNIIKKLMENKRDISSDQYENLLHSIACRCAIKANDKTDIDELTALIRQVYDNDEIRHCPHGRPVVIAMSKGEIEKKFGRI